MSPQATQLHKPVFDRALDEHTHHANSMYCGPARLTLAVTVNAKIEGVFDPFCDIVGKASLLVILLLLY